MTEINVNKYLEKNEKVITTASPIGKYYINKGAIIFGFIWGLIDFTAMGAAFRSASFSIIIFVCLFMAIHLMPFWLALRQIYNYFVIHKKCKYVITNKRLLVIDNKKTSFVNHNNISNIELKHISDFRYKDVGSIHVYKQNKISSISQTLAEYSSINLKANLNIDILIKPIENATEFYNTLSQYISGSISHQDETKTKTCAYCGTSYDANQTKCPSCGASNTKKTDK